MAVSVAVLGAGAVGGMLGVLLAEAGHDVTVLASDRTATAINVNGLVLHSVRYGELRVRVPARPWLTAPVDVLFVTVKAPDLLAALTRAPASLLDGAAVVPLLNGVEQVPLLRAVLPQAAVVSNASGASRQSLRHKRVASSGAEESTSRPALRSNVAGSSARSACPAQMA